MKGLGHAELRFQILDSTTSRTKSTIPRFICSAQHQVGLIPLHLTAKILHLRTYRAWLQVNILLQYIYDLHPPQNSTVDTSLITSKQIASSMEIIGDNKQSRHSPSTSPSFLPFSSFIIHFSSTKQLRQIIILLDLSKS